MKKKREIEKKEIFLQQSQIFNGIRADPSRLSISILIDHAWKTSPCKSYYTWRNVISRRIKKKKIDYSLLRERDGKRGGEGEREKKLIFSIELWTLIG